MRRIIPALVLALALLAPPAAHAVEIAKRFGLGYQLTLAGAQGITARYQATPSIGLELIAGFGSTWADDRSDVGWFDTLFVAGGFSFVLASDDRGFLSLGTRVNVGTSTFDRRTSADPATSSKRVTDIAFEVPLTIEYFISPHFSLRAGVGLVFAILHPEHRVLTGNDELDDEDRTGGSSVSLGPGEVLGNAGFTVWF